jgi:hypothetical protein
VAPLGAVLPKTKQKETFKHLIHNQNDNFSPLILDFT